MEWTSAVVNVTSVVACDVDFDVGVLFHVDFDIQFIAADFDDAGFNVPFDDTFIANVESVIVPVIVEFNSDVDVGFIVLFDVNFTDDFDIVPVAEVSDFGIGLVNDVDALSTLDVGVVIVSAIADFEVEFLVDFDIFFVAGVEVVRAPAISDFEVVSRNELYVRFITDVEVATTSDVGDLDVST